MILYLYSMKYTFLLSAFILFWSCKNSENTAVSSIPNFPKAIVSNELEKEGCAWIIKTKENGEIKLLEPIAIEEAFRKNGLTIEIAYRVSRSASHCPNTTPAVLEKIMVAE